MARTNISDRATLQLCPTNHAARARLKAKLDEHDTALDALEGVSDYKASVRCATTANHALSGLTAIDGVTPVAGNRVLAKSQTATEENGIYVAASGAWSRAADADSSADVTAGLSVFVSEGTVNGDTIWDLTTNDAIVLGTTGLTFTKRPTLAEFASTANGKGAALVGIEDSANQITGATVEAALAEIVPKTIQKRTVTVTDDELTGASQAVNVGAALPANAIVLGRSLVVTEQFAGQSDLTITLGGTDADGIIASTDLDALAAGTYCGTDGVAPTGSYGSQQLVATFAATNLATLSAGSVAITVWFFVLA